MRELQQKQKLKSRLYSVPALILFAIVTALIARGTFAVIQKEEESRADVTALQTKITTLSDQQANMKADIASLNTEAGIDKEIKEKFNVSSPGEHVAIIVDAANSTTSAPVAPAWYKRVWDDILSVL